MAQKKTIKDIKKSLPGIETSPGAEKVEVLADELDRILAIKRLFKSEGGEDLLNVLKGNCAKSLLKLIQVAREKPELNLLLSIIFDYAANMDLLATVQDIGIEDELRIQLDEAVKEAMS